MVVNDVNETQQYMVKYMTIILDLLWRIIKRTYMGNNIVEH